MLLFYDLTHSKLFEYLLLLLLELSQLIFLGFKPDGILKHSEFLSLFLDVVLHPGFHLFKVLFVDPPLVHECETCHGSLRTLSILQLKPSLQLNVFSIHKFLFFFVSHSNMQKAVIKSQSLISLVETHLSNVFLAANETAVSLLLLHGSQTLKIKFIGLVNELDVKFVQNVVHLLLIVRVNHHTGGRKPHKVVFPQVVSQVGQDQSSFLGFFYARTTYLNVVRLTVHINPLC